MVLRGQQEGFLRVMEHLDYAGSYMDLLVIKCVEAVCVHTHRSTRETNQDEIDGLYQCQ